MARGGGRDFDKTIHHYEPWINEKRHKVSISMKFGGYKDDDKPQFYTKHFKDAEGSPEIEF